MCCGGHNECHKKLDLPRQSERAGSDFLRELLRAKGPARWLNAGRSPVCAVVGGDECVAAACGAAELRGQRMLLRGAPDVKNLTPETREENESPLGPESNKPW